MQTVRVWSLLLLCSLSGAELQDHDLLRPEMVNVVEQPQSCPSDVQAVLRELSFKLGKHEVRIEQLHTLNQEQNIKLTKYEVKIEQLHTLNQEQNAKLQELQNQNQAQAAELKSLKTQFNVTETQVEALSRDRAVRRVAFSASLLASGAGNTGPISAHTTLVFRNVVSNTGNAYNSNTGIFTAPVGGAYHFEFYFHAGASPPGVVGLVKNEEHVFIAQENPSGGGGTGANGVTLVLRPGDVVFLRLWSGYSIYDNQNHYSTFSGHLLFLM